MPELIAQTFSIQRHAPTARRQFSVHAFGTSFVNVSLSIRGLEELKELSRTIQKFLIEQELQEGASS